MNKYFLLVVLLALSVPSFSTARRTAEVIAPASNVGDLEEARAKRLAERLEEIKGISKKELSRVERKALRGEVKAIKKEMAQISGGVYLSVGAILLVALLLILLL